MNWEISGGLIAKTFMVAAKTDVYIPFRIRPPPKICDLEFSCRQEPMAALASAASEIAKGMSAYP
jgi:hypothetical protein